MGRGKQRVLFGIFCMLLLSALFSNCSSVRHMRITYGPPPPDQALQGKNVFIEFQDSRETTEIFGEGAREKYKYISPNVDLYIALGEGEASRRGLRDISSLFKEAFTERIEGLGGRVVSRGSEADVVLSIILQSFKLDMEDWVWSGLMEYEARLSREGGGMAWQNVKSGGERVKIIGVEQADRVMSDLFTRGVNEVDLVSLFGRLEEK